MKTDPIMDKIMEELPPETDQGDGRRFNNS